MKNYLISIIFSLIIYLQFLIRGWPFIGISILSMIIFYNLNKKKGSIYFTLFSALILINQVIMYILKSSSLLEFIFIIISALIFFVAASDEKKVDILKKYLKENSEDPKKFKYDLCFFGMGEIDNLENMKNLSQAVLAYNKDKIAYNVKLITGEYSRIISKKEIEDYGLIRVKKSQEPYYPKLWEMVWPSPRLRTLHKPYLETFILAIQLKDERITFYEEPKILYKITKELDDKT